MTAVQREKCQERGKAMNVKKESETRPEALSERELAAVSGGEEAIGRGVNPKECFTCGQPLTFTPTGYYCSKCGYSLTIEIRG
jgi:hypothetical protein